MAGKKKKKGGHEEEHVDERWLLTYADMITLLMALFIVMWSMATVNTSKFEALSQSLKDAFSGKILPGGEAVLNTGSSSANDKPAAEDPIEALKATNKSESESSAASREDDELKKLKVEIDSWTK